jgi:hypothetical protein
MKNYSTHCAHIDGRGLHTIGLHLKCVIEGNHKQFVVTRYGIWGNLHDFSKKICFGFVDFKTQFCKRIMLLCVIKIEICESILFTYLKIVFRSMFYNDDGFLVNITYNDHLQFYTSTSHLFFIFLNYG